ncbi:hypothetical protein SISSUDRAFT_1129509, partial [Sistotremastrum suecicum HHB10207 ss-3]
MAQDLPAEIFHRIIFNFLLVPQASQRIFASEYHLVKDRQVCHYALCDFKNVRLVCRLWNRWLLHDFDFWRHLRVDGANSLTVAKDAMTRFPGYPFHIRICADPHPDAKKMFKDDGWFVWDFGDSDSNSDDSNDGFITDSADEEGVSDGNDTSEDDDDESQNSEISSSSNDEGSTESDGGTESSDTSKFYEEDERKETGMGPSAGAAVAENDEWIDDAIILFMTIIPTCEGIHLHLPTQSLHTALAFWGFFGAPKLHSCTFEAVDYDGRNVLDLRRYNHSANPRDHKPLTPPVKWFLQKSPLLSSVSIINYYVPSAKPEDLGFDVTQLTDFTMVYNRQDGPIVGPMSIDVDRSLLLPAISHECRNITLDLRIDPYAVDTYRLRGYRNIEKLALGAGHFIYRPYTQDRKHAVKLKIDVGEDFDFHFRTLVLANTKVWMPVRTELPTTKTMLQFFLHEMINLESLYLMSVEIHSGPAKPTLTPAPYAPPDTSLPNLTNLLIDGGNIAMDDILALIKRAPSLTRLTITAKCSDKIDGISTALGTIQWDEDSQTGSVLCPNLQRFQVLYSDFADDEDDDPKANSDKEDDTDNSDDSDSDSDSDDDGNKTDKANTDVVRLTTDMFVDISLLEDLRKEWAEHCWCVPMEVKFTRRANFHSGYYEDM